MVLAAEEEALREGLPPSQLDFSGLDNAACRELIERRPAPGMPGGLFALLEDECQVPKGSDVDLREKFFKAAGKSHPSLKRVPRPDLGFVIRHYAGEVRYDMAGFLSKNKDRLAEDLLVLLRRSSREFVKVLFAPTAAEEAAMSSKRGARFTGVVARFGANLGELASQLETSMVHFGRTIKPNAQLQPRLFNEPKVEAQLRCNAVLTAIMIMKAGFPDRIPHCLLYTSDAADDM
eukprot:550904-Prymnesium_polylepis.1